MKTKKAIQGKKSNCEYYYTEEKYLSRNEAQRNKQPAYNSKRVLISQTEHEKRWKNTLKTYKEETLKSFLKAKKSEIKDFLQSHGCEVGEVPFFTKATSYVNVPDDFKEGAELTSMYLSGLKDLQAAFDAGNHEQAIISAFKLGDQIARLFLQEHLHDKPSGRKTSADPLYWGKKVYDYRVGHDRPNSKSAATCALNSVKIEWKIEFPKDKITGERKINIPSDDTFWKYEKIYLLQKK